MVSTDSHKPITADISTTVGAPASYPESYLSTPGLPPSKAPTKSCDRSKGGKGKGKQTAQGGARVVAMSSEVDAQEFEGAYPHGQL